MYASPADPTSPTRSLALCAGPTRTRIEIGVPERTIFAQSARAIAQSRELELRVKRLEARFRTLDGRAVMLVDAALATLAARRNAPAIVRSDLVATVSHEMRARLQAILGYSELLVHDATQEFTETQREFARRIVVSGLSLAQVVENLIQLSAAQLARMHLDIRSFDLKRLIADVVRLADPSARHKGIVLRADLVPLEMTSDVRCLRQIVANLVEDAIKRTERGDVVVSLSAGSAPGHNLVRIVVRNSGRAIDAADLPHVFQPFWQGREPVPVSMHDTGLCLSTVRHLTSLLGGEVRAEAAPSGGSTFTVELPRVVPASESLAG